MTKEQALQIVTNGSEYFVQSYILKNGNLKLSKTHGPYSATDAEKVRAMSTTQRGKFKKRSMIEGVKNKACLDCGITKSLKEMTFDHIKGKKLFNIAKGSGKSWNLLKKELDKCEIVCRSCHNIREFQRGVSSRLTSIEDLAELLSRLL